jgi:hypothetical protein
MRSKYLKCLSCHFDNLYGGGIWLIHISNSTLQVLLEDSFLHTSHNAPPVRDHQCSTAGQGQDERAPSTPLLHLRGLDLLCS